MLAASRGIGKIDDRFKPRLIALGFDRERLPVEREVATVLAELEDAGAAHALTGNIETLDPFMPREDRDGATHCHGVDFASAIADPLAEIVDRQAHFVVGIALGAEQVEDFGDQFLARIGAFDKKVLHPLVGVGEEHFADRGCAVAPRAAAFLVVGLYAARHLPVADEANIRPVDPHTKGIRRHHHI